VIGLLWLVPAIPFASAASLLLFGGRFSRRAAVVAGVGSIGLSALFAILVAAAFVTATPAGHACTQVLWTWIDVAGFRPQIAFYLDALSLVMILVVTFVGFLIHIYAAEFMAEDQGFTRYFGYMNLFVASMITLLLGNNLLLLMLGWEGVGLCSFLLVGFWYREPANGAAARKAFIVTRICCSRSSAPCRFRNSCGGLRSSGAPDPLARLRRRSCCWAEPWASQPNCRCRSGCRMPWPAPRPPAHSSTRPPW
jgi:NADH-quinone oxidoreductase subunit L